MKHLDTPDGLVTLDHSDVRPAGRQRVQRFAWIRWLAWSWLVFLTGCGGCGGGLPGVTGAVTLNGAPLTNGTVQFHPTSRAAIGYATIQSDGSYSARTGNQEGLPAGDYIVTVHANADDGASKIPPKYTDSKLSDKKVTVADGDVDFNIDL